MRGTVPLAASATSPTGIARVDFFVAGTLLGSVGYEVTLVRIFEPPSEKPVTLVRPDGTRQAIPTHRVTKTENSSRPDLILVAVKMPALAAALQPTLKWPNVSEPGWKP